MSSHKQYYESAHDLTTFCQNLKQLSCPHCRRRGSLIRHGYLRGYGEHPDRKIRGRRFFCSNRQRRYGCGKTFSLLAAELLRGFSITAVTLWCFLLGFAKGLPAPTAFRATGTSLNIRASWRLLRRIDHAQTRLRSILHRHFPIPESPDSRQPILQTVAHLKAAFPHASCPVTAFQNARQVSFL